MNRETTTKMTKRDRARLKRKREKLGLSLLSVAIRVGVNPSTVQRWETSEATTMRAINAKAWKAAIR